MSLTNSRAEEIHVDKLAPECLASRMARFIYSIIGPRGDATRREQRAPAPDNLNEVIRLILKRRRGNEEKHFGEEGERQAEGNIRQTNHKFARHTQPRASECLLSSPAGARAFFTAPSHRKHDSRAILNPPREA